MLPVAITKRKNWVFALGKSLAVSYKCCRLHHSPRHEYGESVQNMNDVRAKQMIKNSLLGCCLWLSTAAFGIEITVEDPCSSQAWLTEEVALVPGTSLGQMSLEAFDRADLTYQGSPAGILSIRGLVPSNKALEIRADGSMRAYGWCYLLNGSKLEKMPDQAFPENERDQIVWYLGFATYQNGSWGDYCIALAESQKQYMCAL